MNQLAQLRLQTLSGDTHARAELVQRLLVTPRGPSQPQEAMRILSAACDEGDPTALLLHATLAARGIGREQNFEDAVALVARAAAQGDSDAQGQLNVLGGKFNRETWFAPMQMRQHHAAPRIFTIEKFIPKPVCAWLIKYARRRLGPSFVSDAATNQNLMSAGRSADMAGASALEADLVIQLTKLRIAGAVQLHVVHQEPTAFLHYGRGQEYQAHYDLIRPQEEAAAADELRTLGQRVATVLIYLNDGYLGGETHFPHLNWGFKGKPGDALIFWNISATGERERLSLHAGAPVQKGEKWLLSNWVRAHPVPLI